MAAMNIFACFLEGGQVVNALPDIAPRWLMRQCAYLLNWVLIQSETMMLCSAL